MKSSYVNYSSQGHAWRTQNYVKGHWWYRPVSRFQLNLPTGHILRLLKLLSSQTHRGSSIGLPAYAPSKTCAPHTKSRRWRKHCSLWRQSILSLRWWVSMSMGTLASPGDRKAGIRPSSLCSPGAHRSGSQQSTASTQSGARGVPVSTERIAGRLNPVGMGRAAHRRMFPEGRVGTRTKTTKTEISWV